MACCWLQLGSALAACLPADDPVMGPAISALTRVDGDLTTLTNKVDGALQPILHVFTQASLLRHRRAACRMRATVT
jgi:hypothetical protein